LVGQWRDTGLAGPMRSADLPLFGPPMIELEAMREGEAIRVILRGEPEQLGLRWEAEGVVEGSGREVLWHPDGPLAQLRVAARTEGGVAVAALRARSIQDIR
jgi:hypothetical protein